MPVSMLSLWNTTTRSHWDDPAWRNRYRYNMSKTPFLGDFIRAEDYSRFWDDYFKNRPGSGGWENVKYPSLMSGAGTLTSALPSSRSALGFVSKNLTSLYDKKKIDRWSPAAEPSRRIRTNIGIGGGRFYHYGY